MGEGLSFSTFIRDTARDHNIFALWEDSLKLGGRCGVCEQAVDNSLSSIAQGYNTEAYNCPVREQTWASKQTSC